MESSNGAAFPRPARREEADAGGHGYIEAADAAGDRNAHDPVALLARQAPQPLAFRAQDPGDRTGQVRREQALAAGIRTCDPYTRFLHFAQRPRKVGHGDDRDRVGGAAGRFRDSSVDADRAVLRHDHRMRAERVCAAQAGAQVVRIGDAVEHEQQRRLRWMLEDIGERDVRQRGIDLGDDALMALRSRELVEAPVIDGVNAHASRFRPLDQLARPVVTTAGGHEQLAQRLRVLAQPCGDRVESDDEPRFGQQHFRVRIRCVLVDCNGWIGSA